MKKKLQRVLAGCVAVGLCMSMISVTALADDGFDVSDETSTNEIQMAVTMLSSVASTDEDATGSDDAESSTVENSDGSTTTTTTENTTITVGEDEYSASQTTEETKQTTEEKNEDGNTETTTTTNSSWTIEESEDSSGVDIGGSGSEYTEITDVTASDGDAVSQTGSISGESGTTITETVSEPSTKESEGTEEETPKVSELDESVTIDVKPGETQTAEGTLIIDVTKYVEKAEEAAGTYDVLDSETGDVIGSVEVTVERIESDDNELVGYTKTETVTTPGNIETVIPDIPESSTVVDEDTGYTTTVTVTEVKDESTGEVIGYTAVTSVSDATGFVISERTETVTGEKTTSESAVTTTVTTRVYDLEALVAFTVTMGEVVDNSTSSMSSLLNPIAAAHDKKTDTSTDLYGAPNRSNYPDESYTKIDGYDYAWLGEYGLESAIRVYVGQNELAHQFVLVSTKEGSEEKYYVYCADLSTDAQTGYSYKIVNLEDADYYDDEAAAHIRAIASVGYWGTESGTGSLQQLKETLYKAIVAGETTLTREQVNQITEGMALTATQAAIWTYGNNGTELAVRVDNIVGSYNNGEGYSDSAVDSEKAAITQALYEYLVGLTEDPVGEDTLINENSITSASITVNSVATDDNGEIIMKDDDIVYDTDVSFILAVEPDENSSELKVEIIDTDTGEVLETRVITGSTDEYEKIVCEEQEDGSVIYTIKGVTLADGTNIDIQLTGTQDMQGVYLFTSEDKDGTLSQTFVGLANGTQTVDISVGLTFNATDPTADYTDTETTTELKVMDITEWWSDEWVEENFEKPDEPDEPESPEIPVVPVTPSTPAQPEAPATGTTEVAAQPETTTEAAETAESQPASEAVISDVPMTGDEANVAIYLVMAALSGAALIGLGVTGRKKNEEV